MDIPSVTFQDVNRQEYITSLAKIEAQISSRKIIARRGISNAIKHLFHIDGDCFQIFEKRSGGILFKDWEWQLISNENPLKELFETKVDEKYSYCLETDEGKILRGADTYYYFVSNKGKNQDVTKDMTYEWMKANITFLKEAINNFPRDKVINHVDRRLLLGVLDNVRNISLIMLNANIVNCSNASNALLELQNLHIDKNIEKWSEICKTVASDMKDLCFAETIDDVFVYNTHEFIKSVIETFKNNIKEILNTFDSFKLNKSFRSYREIDNFIENYIGINYAIEQIKVNNPQVLNRPLNFIGATYGGLELPFIANTILDDEILTSAIILQSKYKDRDAKNYLMEQLNVQSSQDFEKFSNILCDDNVLTGKTLQGMINILFSNEIPIDQIAIIRYPSINRVNQMFAENSIIDTSKFFSYIQGLVFSSPYTKIKSDEKGQYLDALGLFNKDRHRLLEYLYKNGKYSEESEVASIGKGVKL